MVQIRKIVLLLVLVALWVGTGALAHPRLKVVDPTSPKPGELLTASPPEARLAFLLGGNETGLDVFSSVGSCFYLE